MKRVKRNDQGLLSLEACIVVTIFLFFMLYLYSFFVVFEARNDIGHATLATANSLALDAYESGNLWEGHPIASALNDLNLFFGSEADRDNKFVNKQAWYDEQGSLVEAAKERFVAYFANSDTDEANRKLKILYNIEGGLEGLDFSESKVVEDDLYLVVKYKMNYEFQVFNLDGVEITQSACSKLWR